MTRAKIGVVGFCIGGHLAFRAAFQLDVLAAVCYYGTGMTASSVRTQMPDHWPVQKKSVVNF